MDDLSKAGLVTRASKSFDVEVGIRRWAQVEESRQGEFSSFNFEVLQELEIRLVKISSIFIFKNL